MPVVLWVAVATAATIAEPRWGEPFANGAAVEQANDVFAVGEAVPIEIVGLAPDDGCVLEGPDGLDVYDAAHPACSPADDGSVTCVDAVATERPGDWTLTCSDADVAFRVADVSERLWLPAGGGPQLFEELVAVDIGTGCDDEYAADPWANRDPTWVRACAWKYVLDQAVAQYAREPGVAVRRFSWRNGPQPAHVDEPEVMLAAADVRPYGNVLERLALAWLVARQDPDGSTFGDLEAEYAQAVRYWGQHLVDHWDEASPDDLEQGRLLMALSAAYDWSWPALTLDERRAWRDVIAREAADASDTASPLYPQYPYLQRRQLRNSHTWMQRAGPAIAAYVLDDELAWADAPATWRGRSEPFFEQLLDELGDMGDHNGPFYAEYGLVMLVRVLDAATLVDSLLADAFDEPWVRSLPEALAHGTLPNGQRAAFADGVPQDNDKPSSLYARLAGEPGAHALLAQRLAWQGHNRWTYANNRRDVFDVLWWDATRPAMDDAAFAARHPHACMGGVGIGSLRTGWSPDDAHMIYLGGPLFGGHDDPAVGSFLLYAGGHLVVGDEFNMAVKRTALHSTLLVDGKGQHGDFAAFTVSPPENRAGTTESNDSRLLAWLDGSGRAGSGSVDVVGFGTDLTQLYRYDPDHDDSLRADPNDWPRWFTNVEGKTKLDSLRRYVVWLDGRAFVYDRFQSSGRGAFRYDTLLATGATGADERGVSCPVTAKTSTQGLYRDGQGRTIGLRFDGYGTRESCDHPNNFPCIACSPGTGACPTHVELAQQLNRGEWQPVVEACPNPVTVDGTVATVDASVGGAAVAGRLRAVALDGLAWTLQPNPWKDGRQVRGYRLSRTRSAPKGYFLAELTPYVDAPPAAATATPVSGGSLVQVPLGSHDATLLFDDATRATVSEGGKSGSELAGHVGVVLHDASGPLAAQVLHGTKLSWRKQPLVEATSAASVSVTWGPEVAWGRVEEVSGAVDVWIWTNGRSPGLLTVETAVGTTATVPVVDSAGGVRFRVDAPATFRLVHGQDDGSRPGSVCR